MLNNIVLVGRLTRDPELRTTTSGMTVASFTLASDDNRGGQKTTVFIPVSVFGKQADVVAKFTRKGALVGVTGRLTQRKYVRRTDNVEVTSTEIVADRIDLMEPKGTGAGAESEAGYVADAPAYRAPVSQVRPEPASSGLDPLLEDDLPF